MIGQVSLLCDLSDDSSSDPELRRYFETLAAADNRQIAQQAVAQITEVLFARCPAPLDEPLSLIPVLRGGLGMWAHANAKLASPNTLLLSAQKTKGSRDVKLQWLSDPRELRSRIIVLDTVTATGDTVGAVVDEIRRHDSPDQPRRISLYTCYASPEAVQALTRRPASIDVANIAILSRTVDAAGYLVPYTNGDIGGKLFS